MPSTSHDKSWVEFIKEFIMMPINWWCTFQVDVGSRGWVSRKFSPFAIYQMIRFGMDSEEEKNEYGMDKKITESTRHTSTSCAKLN